VKLPEIKTRTDIPSDVNTLQDLLWSSVVELRDLSQKYALLRKELFGKKSEKQSIPLDEQMALDALLVQAQSKVQPEAAEDFVNVPSHDRRRKHPGRNAIPEEVKRERHVLDITEDEKKCVGCSERATCKYGELPVLEEVVRKVVERKAPEYVVHEYVRIKRACPIKKDEVKVVEPPLVTPISKGLAGLELLVFVLVSKYQFHLPLYRIQRQIYHESRIWFTRGTMVGWIAELCVLLKRVYREMVANVKSSPCIFSDDSRLRQVTRELGSKTCFMWVYLGLSGRLVIFDYRDGRGSDAPREFLNGVVPGTYLMTDEYAAYNDAVKRYGLIQMACWMHIRREFIESAEVNSQKEFSLRIVRFIGQLYRIERFAKKKEMTTEQRLSLRRAVSVPVMKKIHDALISVDFVLLPQNRITKAINYALRNWQKAQVFLTDGSLPIDNGPSERVIRDLAIGRKNWNSVGSKRGGKWMAILYSIIATCKLNGIDIEAYFRDVLMRLAMRPENASVTDLTPLEWHKANNGGKLPDLKPIYPSKN
jgi:transposase